MVWLEDPAGDPVQLQQSRFPSPRKLAAFKTDISLSWGVCQGTVLPFQVVNTGWWEYGPDSGLPYLCSWRKHWVLALLLPNWLCLRQATSLAAWVTVLETVRIPFGFELV